jgi:fructose-bisphosphate aldolase class I
MDTPTSQLLKTTRQLVAPGKGILAADESFPTIKKRFDSIDVESTKENRRAYREILFTTKGVEEFISGVIMFDETLRLPSLAQGKPAAKILKEKGIIPGIKVDEGKVDIPDSPGEKITKGLDGLTERLKEYKGLGARFTKWRAVITIGEGLPTEACIDANAKALGRFAALSQEAGLVPVVEPEVLMDGSHSIESCKEATTRTLTSVFSALEKEKVVLAGMLLKTNMVIPGKDSPQKASPQKVAEATLACFRRVVPEELPGIVFLSGGQGPEEATENLNAMNLIGNVPWELSFSYGRALQRPALEAWKGKGENRDKAQQAFYHRAKLNSVARYGKYTKEMEGSV